MPNLNGTGPRGRGAMTGRKRGRRRATEASQVEKSKTSAAEKKDIVYGVGRGGRTRGGGLGKRSGGKGKGRRTHH